MLERNEFDESEGGANGKMDKTGVSLVELAYRRAKAVKAKKKAVDAGKVVKKPVKKAMKNSDRSASRSEEMRDLFQNYLSERKGRKRSTGPAKKKSSFMSQSRYKRR